MPELDGFQATRAIRSREVDVAPHDVTINGRPRRYRLPIITITANSMKGDSELCLGAGMDAYISKPVTSQELAEVLDRLLLKLESMPYEPSHL